MLLSLPAFAIGVLVGGVLIPVLLAWNARRPPRNNTTDGHLIDGACRCICPQCVAPRKSDGYLICVCPDCNQDCPAVGRVGYRDDVEEELRSPAGRGRAVLIGPEPHGKIRLTRNRARAVAAAQAADNARTGVHG